MVAVERLDYVNRLVQQRGRVYPIGHGPCDVWRSQAHDPVVTTKTQNQKMVGNTIQAN